MDPRMYPEQSIQQPGFNPQNNIHMEIQQQRPHITYTYDLPSAFPHPPVDDFQADINHPNSYYNAEQSDTFMTPFQLQNLPQGAQLQEMEQFQRLHQMLQMQQLQQMQHMQRIHHMQQINAQNPQGNINGPHSRPYGAYPNLMPEQVVPTVPLAQSTPIISQSQKRPGDDLHPEMVKKSRMDVPQMNQGPFNQVPMNQGSFNQVPMSQGPFNQAQMNQGPFNQVPMSQGPFNQVPVIQGPFNQVPMSQGQTNQAQMSPRPTNLAQMSTRPTNQVQMSPRPSNPPQTNLAQANSGQGSQNSSRGPAPTPQPSADQKLSLGERVHINVGGKMYSTISTTILKHGDGITKRMRQQRVLTQNGPKVSRQFMIDRDGESFRHILNFLRMDDLILPENYVDFKLLYDDAIFYGIEPLAKMIANMMHDREEKKDIVYLI